MEGIIIDRATINDIDFITDTIVAAEKSGTDNFGLAKLFGVDDNTMKSYIKTMLEEEIDGCEMSLSSFLVARHDGRPVAAFAGWVEGSNEDNMPSALIKSNLLSFVLPQECLIKSRKHTSIVRSLQIEREEGAYQLEYSYTLPEYRGKGLMKDIINSHIAEYQQITSLRMGLNDSKLERYKKIQVHVFENNKAAIRTYESCGFKTLRRYHSDENGVDQFFPDRTLLLMELFL